MLIWRCGSARPERDRTAPRRSTDDGTRGGTTHLTVVDNDRNAVAMTCTLGPSFGCMHIVPGTGIILNNEGVFFDLDPLDGPNYPAAGKRVQHDMSPTMVFRGDRLFLALGTPGALGITQTIPQVIPRSSIMASRCKPRSSRTGTAISAPVERAWGRTSLRRFGTDCGTRVTTSSRRAHRRSGPAASMRSRSIPIPEP